ncbi:Pyocin-S2 [compost metagenome]
MSNKHLIHLDPTITTASRPFEIPRSVITTSQFPVLITWDQLGPPSVYQTAHFSPGRLVMEVVHEIQSDRRQLQDNHTQQSKTLIERLDQAIENIALSGSPLSPVQSLERHVAAAAHLLLQFQDSAPATLERANRFFGSDPLAKSVREVVAAAASSPSLGGVRSAWSESYQAALEHKLLENAIDQLQSRLTLFRTALANAKYEQAQQEALRLQQATAQHLDLTRQQVQQAHIQHQSTLIERLDDAIVSMAAPTEGLGPVESLERHLAAVDLLLTQFRDDAIRAHQRALAYSGSNPVPLETAEFLANVSQHGDSANAVWRASYEAAFEARLTENAIVQLESRRELFHSTLVRARDEAYLRYTTNERLLRAELALNQLFDTRHLYQQAKTSLQRQLESFNHLTTAAETSALDHALVFEREVALLTQAQSSLDTRLAALASSVAQTVEAGKGLALTLQSDTPTYPLERRHEVLDLQQRLQQQRSEHQQQSTAEQLAVGTLKAAVDSAIQAATEKQASLAAVAATLPVGVPPVFHAYFSARSKIHALAASKAAVALFEHVLPSLARIFPLAESALLKRVAVGAAGNFATLMLYSPELGNGERIGLSIPLEHLHSELSDPDTRSSIGQTVALPLRVGMGPLGDQSQLYVAATDGLNIPKDVRVRSASWDNEQRAYRFVADGSDGATLLWHPADQPNPGDNATTRPIEEQPHPDYPGLIHVPETPVVLPYPGLEDAGFDDYIVVFPADSGLAPVYVMFRDPRKIPGVVSGYGQVTPDRMLDAASTAKGAPIPTRIAEKLIGRRYSSFDKLRNAFWKAVAADEVFSRHFSPLSIDEMKDGRAPFPSEIERVGGRKKYEIHHIHQISSGGGVYDLNNLVIMTPRSHIDHHTGKRQ